MRRVYKYPIAAKATKFSIHLPRNFKFLRVGLQADQVQMWAEVDPDMGSKQIMIDFQVFGTGQDIPDGYLYLGTYDIGPFVLHLYQITDTKAPYV